MIREDLEASIRAFKRRLKHPIYDTDDYFALTKDKRQRVLDDFNTVILLLRSIGYDHRKLRGWWKDSDERFQEGFLSLWLSVYVVNIYVTTLGTNRVIDTFLNDPLQGKKGVLNQFRGEHRLIAHKRLLLRFLPRAVKLKIASELMKRYPLELRGELHSARKYVKFRLLQLWLPTQYFFVKLLAHRKWWFKKDFLVKDRHLDDLEPFLKKGDVLLHRTNYMIHNITMPGFWNHAMIYDGKGHIIEATPGKVRRVRWRKAAIADYVCVLRPKCSDKKKDAAVKYAKKQIGKPYDFNFDFLSDQAYVCSELILKSYPFLRPKIEDMYGRKVYPVINILDLVEEEKFETVYFLDGRQFAGRVIIGTAKELLETKYRLRWDLMKK